MRQTKQRASDHHSPVFLRTFVVDGRCSVKRFTAKSERHSATQKHTFLVSCFLPNLPKLKGIVLYLSSLMSNATLHSFKRFFSSLLITVVAVGVVAPKNAFAQAVADRIFDTVDPESVDLDAEKLAEIDLLMSVNR